MTASPASAEATPLPCAVIGGAGLTGRELLHILRRHPRLQPVVLTSDRHAGSSLAVVFPELEGEFPAELRFTRHDAPLPPECPVFLATPNQSSLELAPRLLDAGHPVVDLSGAFRLHDRSIFEEFYQLKHTAWDRMESAAFGVPELFRDAIKRARLIANPGCFSTGAILPLHLLGDLRGRVRFASIDAKSGVSGAGGRVEDGGFPFNHVYENFRAYKILKHQHEPEIREYASAGLETELPLVFTPHLLPIYRGILTTITILWDGPAPADLADRLQAACEGETFLRFRATPEEIEVQRVQHSNYLDLSLRSRGDTSVIVSALDNLQKGAAGQAVQNMNLLLGLPESAGLLGRAEAPLHH